MMRYERLVVIEEKIINGRGYSVCQCDCGNVTTIRNDSLKKGTTKSCGCITKEIARTGDHRRTHGMHGSRLYRIWLAMKTRCNNPNTKRFKDYGGRGITVCEEWTGKDGFIHFHDWSILNRYSDELSIDRINNDGNYAPDNCRWATCKEQNSNKRKQVASL